MYPMYCIYLIVVISFTLVRQLLCYSLTRYNYDCVITGWSALCEAEEEWIQQMGVNRLPLGPEQPFYHVLVDDGTNRYAAQG